MGFLAQSILPYILLYKYWAIFVITFLASLALPIPAGTLLIASAAFASQGYFNIFILVTVAVVANIIGDTALYWLARGYGRKVLSRIKLLRKIITSRNFVLIEKRIAARPGFIIFITRFEVLSTLTVNLISGLGKVPFRKFLFFEALGAIASELFYAGMGYFFGDSWQAVNSVIGNFTLVLFLMIAVAVALFWKKIITNLSKEV